MKQFFRQNVWSVIMVIITWVVSAAGALAAFEPLSKGESKALIADTKNPTLLFDLLGNVAGGLIGLAGSLAFVMVIYAGIYWLFAQGNEERVTKAKNTLIWVILGIILIFSAYMIVNFTLTTIRGATVSNSTTPSV